MPSATPTASTAFILSARTPPPRARRYGRAPRSLWTPATCGCSSHRVRSWTPLLARLPPARCRPDGRRRAKPAAAQGRKPLRRLTTMDVVLDCLCAHLPFGPRATALPWTRCEDCGELVAVEPEHWEALPTPAPFGAQSPAKRSTNGLALS